MASSSSASGWSARRLASRGTCSRLPPCFGGICVVPARPESAAWLRQRRRRSGRGCSSAPLVTVHLPQVRLADQRRRLQGLPRLLLVEPRRQLAQLVANQLQQLVRG